MRRLAVALLVAGGLVWLLRRPRALVGKSGGKATGGVVPGDPAALAASAGVPLPVYALARMIASEAGNRPRAEKLAVGWAARNYARQKYGGDVFKALTSSGPAGSRGRFGSQNLGRYAATGQDPRADDLEIAIAVYARAEPDPTGGGTRFDSPRAQDALAKRGKVKGYNKDSAAVGASRRSEGFREVQIAGIDPRALRVWARAGAA